MGDVISFNKGPKKFRGEIEHIGFKNGFAEYTIIDENGDRIKATGNARGVVVFKFKKGQTVNSFHYNENMRSTTFEQGTFVRFISEKIAIVKFGGKKREVRVDGLEADASLYHIGSGVTRAGINEIIKYDWRVNGINNGIARAAVTGIQVDHNANLRIELHNSEYHWGARSFYITKKL